MNDTMFTIELTDGLRYELIFSMEPLLVKETNNDKISNKYREIRIIQHKKKSDTSHNKYYC